LRIAIVGAGIAGLTCAHLLHPRDEITMFEADDRPGGHTTIDGSYLMFAVGAVMAPEEMPAVEADAARVASALAPYATGGDYLSFVERRYDVSRGFDEQSWRRLQAVKAEVDPDGIFAANHEIR
jgi:phytoene dehydrogenase-like protein